MVSFLGWTHASMNLVVDLAFWYQGSVGWRIRRRRLGGAAPDFSLVKRHRKLGPYLILLGLGGYAAGLMTAYLTWGTWRHYPLHLAGGTALALCLGATHPLSARIRGPSSPWRTLHYLLGMIILLSTLRRRSLVS